MIISTGMRTDIPAFYSKWFINRIKDGYVYVRNPYNEKLVTKYLLTPSLVDCICFCTKNPNPMIKYMEELDKFNQLWYVTITPYGKDIEPNVNDKKEVVEAFKFISIKKGIDAICWRYDPIFYGCGWNKEKHLEKFEKIAKLLKGYTKVCVISFLDMYEKIKKNIPNIYPPSKKEQLLLVKELVRIAKENDMVIKSCYEGEYLKEVGADCKGCQTKEMIERVIGYDLIDTNKKNSRGECNCLLGNDIGAYNSCGHLCKYCYANNSVDIVFENIKKHDENSPFLIGNLEKDDKIVVANQKSYVNNQLSFGEF